MKKSISYCCPGSVVAEKLGMSGFYVEQYMPSMKGTNASPDVFTHIDDPDLLQLLEEVDGDYDKTYCQYYDIKGKSPIKKIETGRIT